jgi:hypothetical protein
MPSLAKILARWVFDGARAEEQLGGDLRIRQAGPGQAGDLGLLGGEIAACIGGWRAAAGPQRSRQGTMSTPSTGCER